MDERKAGLKDGIHKPGKKIHKRNYPDALEAASFVMVWHLPFSGKKSHTMKDIKNKHSIFERFSSWVSRAAGSTPAFIGAVTLVLLWLFTGPLFHYSEVWQLFINTGTT